jgi:hypothetical protein
VIDCRRRHLLILAGPLLAALGVALVVLWPSGSNHVTAAPPPTPNMTIAGPGAPVPVGNNFDVNISVDSGTTLFNTYQVEMDVPAGLSYMSGAHKATGTFPSCYTWPTGPVDGPVWEHSSCEGSTDVTFTGLVETITLNCKTAGTYSLNLVDQFEDYTNGSTLIDSYGPITYTNYTPDDTVFVTCQAGPTNTPTITSTPTATATPTGTPCVVGGIAQLAPLAGAASGDAGVAAEGSGWSAGNHAALAVSLAAAVVVLSAGAWCARTRWQK